MIGARFDVPVIAEPVSGSAARVLDRLLGPVKAFLHVLAGMLFHEQGFAHGESRERNDDFALLHAFLSVLQAVTQHVFQHERNLDPLFGFA